MRHLSLLLCLFVTIQAGAKTLLISDIDDTIKSSNIRGNIIEAIRQRPFEGMNYLYTELSNSLRIQYVSAAVGPLIYVGSNFLSSNNFPKGDIHSLSLLEKIQGTSSLKFKVKKNHRNCQQGCFARGGHPDSDWR